MKSSLLTVLAFGTTAVSFLAAPATARPVTYPRPADGKITERPAGPGTWEYEVSLTDAKGLPLPAHGWPKKELGTRASPATFQVLGLVQREGTANAPEEVKDVTQSSQKKFEFRPGADADGFPGLGEFNAANVLYIESVLHDTDTDKYYLASMFGTLAERMGFDNYELRIPDLFADTNGDGTVGAGDVLYSLVDINIYLNAVPSYTPGQSFDIENGRVAELPGMMFSTEPFVFSEDAGWTFASSGLGRSEFSGTGTADSEHGITAVPEPSAVGVMLLGLVATFRRRRLR